MIAGQVKIKDFDEHDRAAVLAMVDRLMTGVATWRDAASAGRAVQSWVADSLDTADAVMQPVFVAVADGAVVGFVTTGRRSHWTGEIDAYVGELVVAQHMARGGVGRQLMTAAESWATRSGYRRLTIETGAANTAARAFYAAAGYAEEEVVLSRALRT